MIGNDADDKRIGRNISLYAEHWAIVDEVNERFGLRNVSSALRLILNDYQRLQRMELAMKQMTAPTSAP